MHPYISIDIETTGLDSSYCQVLEIGAVIEKDWKTPVDLLPRFHAYVVHDRIVGEPYALALNRDILSRIANRHNEPKYTFLAQEHVGAELAVFAAKHGLDPRHLLAAGKNIASFDVNFLRQLDNFDRQIHFKHRFIDPGMLFWNPETDETPPNSKTCMGRAGLDGDVKHTAIEDAQDVIRMVRSATMSRRASQPKLSEAMRDKVTVTLPATNPLLDAFHLRQVVRRNCIATSPMR